MNRKLDHPSPLDHNLLPSSAPADAAAAVIVTVVVIIAAVVIG